MIMTVQVDPIDTTRTRRWTWAVALSVVLLAGLRLASTIEHRRSTDVSQTAIGADATVSIQVFDPDAEAILWVGRDGQPGDAGFDDNGDGKSDDAGELGAVHSDDELVTPIDEAFDQARTSELSRIMFRGVFVDPLEDDEFFDDSSGVAIRRQVTFRDASGEFRVWYPETAE